MKQRQLHSRKKLGAISFRHLINTRSCLFIALNLAMGLSHADCDNAAGRLESSEGKVTIEQNGQWQPLAIGSCVPTNARIQVSDGRAVFRLANETLLRTSSSTLLRFSAPQEKSWIRLFDGILHFITRTPHAFDVETDYVNAGVKGTEFMLTANRAEQYGEIVMLEGEVLASNKRGQQQIRSGEAIIARSGEAPRIFTVPSLRNAVQWTLHYPPLPNSSPRFQSALTYLYRNDAAAALSELEKLSITEHDADYFALLAAIGLHRGEITPARNAIGSALALQPDHAQTLALNSIAELVIGNHAEAKRLLDRANDSRSSAALIARSYLQQAQFELAAALTSAQQAASLDSNSPLIQARIAELSLMTGDISQARQSARNAIALQPEYARAHTIAGFAFMQQLEFDEAETEFKRAIELDATDSLPRLGLGLIQIRHNHVSEGREQLAIAVALDPGQSLLRSYLGKAYQEESRERLASDQYALAKTFDSADPTPWLYSALLAQVQNRPFDALDDLNRSIELNDNRAVYRSRLQLDADEATRTASQAEIYRELGFDTLAQRAAARAVSTAPSEHGGHRQLAEAYADNPQYDAARASEVLQAQLLQPLSATPILPLLGETNLLAIEGAGPSALGFREYNAMFVREKPWLSVSGLGGSNNTGAGEVSLSGVYDRFSYAVSQYHYETAGYRDNNDARYDVTSAYTKFQANEHISFLLQAASREEDRGDLNESLLSDQELPFINVENKIDSVLLGSHVKISSDIDVLATLGYQDGKYKQLTRIPLLDVTFDQDQNTSNAEIQTQISSRVGRFTVGAEWVETDIKMLTRNTTSDPILQLFLEPQVTADETDFYRTGYGYWSLSPFKPLEFTLGVAYAELDADAFTKKLSGWYPKAAIVYRPDSALSLRAAYFQSLRRPFADEQTLEPTQLGGFNQLVDETEGIESDQYAVGFDFDMGYGHHLNGEILTRKSAIPLVDPIDGFLRSDAEQKLGSIAWSWSADPWAISLKYLYEKDEYVEDDQSFEGKPSPLTTHRLPFRIQWQSKAGLSISAVTTYLDQKAEFDRGLTKRSESFTLFDIVASYPFWNRRLEAEFRCNNLFVKSFTYQNINLYDPSPRLSPYIPERTFLAGVKFNY